MNQTENQSKKAIWNGVVIAESSNTVVLEGNHYFPVEDIRKDFFKESATHTVCAWKGQASYYNVEVNGEINKDAAWYYETPSPLAKGIKDRVAFWKGVVIE